MGRSVSYATGAQVVTFRHLESSYTTCDCGADVDTESTSTCDECGSSGFEATGEDFDELVEDFRQQVQAMFPSAEPADRWSGREDHILVENKLAEFGVSEYCGLVSYWIVPKEYDGMQPVDALAKRWIASIADKFVASFGELSKVGTASNGESFYRRIDRN